jgi:hypothetical protein
VEPNRRLARRHSSLVPADMNAPWHHADCRNPPAVSVCARQGPIPQMPLATMHTEIGGQPNGFASFLLLL